IALERDARAASQGDLRLRAMPRAVPPHGEARDEYEVYRALAARLGREAEFTEGRTAEEWRRHMYEEWRKRQKEAFAADLPDYDAVWAAGSVDLPGRVEEEALLGDFRADPVAAPLKTPSGRIELFSATIEGFDLPDCPGYPVWLPGEERLGSPRSRRWPLLLLANQPSGRLHSQQDMGAYSRGQKIAGRTPLRLHPDDAAARGLADGDVVRVHNDRGSLLAGVQVSDELRPGVAQLSTGAWYDPSAPDVTCAHGNPNALTPTTGTSGLSQGCTRQHVLVEVTRYRADPPPVRALEPPVIITPEQQDPEGWAEPGRPRGVEWARPPRPREARAGPRGWFPRTRGWSLSKRAQPDILKVLPAHAGMVPPRPAVHRRGRGVLPAHVGMVPHPGS